ncbi:MAG: hypothetical protein CMC07_07275 [Flavobacteriaceae bacterium]|nr:hypothetical protein [Flavobacteriaceae bacterium]
MRKLILTIIVMVFASCFAFADTSVETLDFNENIVLTNKTNTDQTKTINIFDGWWWCRVVAVIEEENPFGGTNTTTIERCIWLEV